MICCKTVLRAGFEIMKYTHKYIYKVSYQSSNLKSCDGRVSIVLFTVKAPHHQRQH